MGKTHSVLSSDLVTVTTQQDFDVFIDVVTCRNQDLIRFGGGLVSKSCLTLGTRWTEEPGRL